MTDEHTITWIGDGWYGAKGIHHSPIMTNASSTDYGKALLDATTQGLQTPEFITSIPHHWIEKGD